MYWHARQVCGTVFMRKTSILDLKIILQLYTVNCLNINYVD